MALIDSILEEQYGPGSLMGQLFPQNAQQTDANFGDPTGQDLSSYGGGTPQSELSRVSTVGAGGPVDSGGGTRASSNPYEGMLANMATQGNPDLGGGGRDHGPDLAGSMPNAAGFGGLNMTGMKRGARIGGMFAPGPAGMLAGGLLGGIVGGIASGQAGIGRAGGFMNQIGQSNLGGDVGYMGAGDWAGSVETGGIRSSGGGGGGGGYGGIGAPGGGFGGEVDTGGVGGGGMGSPGGPSW